MSESDNHQLHAIVHGRVQGVGFRDATERRAVELGLSGWVRNKPDGTVEVTAEGDRATLERFLEFLHRGPSAARVSRVESQWQPASGRFGDFRVTW
jgi:acylphosphatase